MRRQLWWMGLAAGAALLGFGGLVADAQQKRVAPRKAPPPLVGATVQATIAPERGFVDDPFAIDGAGERLVWINADAASLADLVVLDLRQDGARLATVDISKFSTTPVRVDFALDGEHFFVVSRPSADDPATGALIARSGKVVRTFGPATDVVATTYEGQPAVAVYRRSTQKPRGKKGAPAQVHEIAVHALATGRRVGRAARLVADDHGYVKDLDFRIRYFAGDYTRVVGIKGGSWDRAKDQRSPDHEAWYEVPTGVFSRRIDITDVVAHTRRMELRAKHPNEPAFLVADLDGLRRVDHAGEAKVALPHTFHHYDFRTLTYQRTPAGGFYFTLAIDPYHAEAVERKRADAAYLDLYELAPGATRATRRARLLLAGERKRDHRWHAASGHWVLLPRHLGFGRGGQHLEILRLE